MKILVINCGSSSLKFSLFDNGEKQLERVVSGAFDKIGDSACQLTLNIGFVGNMGAAEKRIVLEQPNVKTHAQATEASLSVLAQKEYAFISSPNEIKAVGHRVVHGGEKFIAPAVIDDRVVAAIEECATLAPLHNPINLEGILAARDLLPHVPHVAVFDTAFHQSLLPEAFLYAIPYEYYQDHGIRRYGFHGSSHKYVFQEAADFLNQNPHDFKAIICHLGNGASITAVSGGKAVDTSMGLTPLEGLVMGTRSGDLDPSIPFFLAIKKGRNISEIEDVLNKKSGLLGLSGCSSDMRDVLAGMADGDRQCESAVKVYVHRIIKYIGAYVSVLDGVDAVVFTAGIGEHSPDIRKRILDRLSWLGIETDEKRNKQAGSQNTLISKRSSSVAVLVIPTDEEKEIAKETFARIQGL